MGHRRSWMDSDEDRLPSGFRRTGYDADTQRYSYTDENGDTYEGPPGSRYGELRRTATRSHQGSANTQGRQQQASTESPRAELVVQQRQPPPRPTIRIPQDLHRSVYPKEPAQTAQNPFGDDAAVFADEEHSPYEVRGRRRERDDWGRGNQTFEDILGPEALAQEDTTEAEKKSKRRFSSFSGLSPMAKKMSTPNLPPRQHKHDSSGDGNCIGNGSSYTSANNPNNPFKSTPNTHDTDHNTTEESPAADGDEKVPKRRRRLPATLSKICRKAKGIFHR
ncbi:hypothetical protein QBC47DRAFT_416245 [Echria macrotheca]|uniref:Uncharacterized protein n=1 Tax=Echria macrotheca TaxID=438768 RepID=A0AAJ0BAZ2_9PEZI|nr:hypothetical protein QBC47DRAFT_416245 [Echria macrotheca]